MKSKQPFGWVRPRGPNQGGCINHTVAYLQLFYYFTRHTFAGVYPGLCYSLPSGAMFARVCGALASPHRLTLGWQSVSENSGDALRPEAPAALLRAAATAPSTRLACPRASTRLRRCCQCSPQLYKYL